MPAPRIETTLGWSAIGDGQAPRGQSNNGGGYRPPWLGAAAGRAPGMGGPAQTAINDPLTRDQVGDLGKTMLSIAPGNTSNVLDQTEEAPKKMPGFAEGFLGGITEAFTGALPGFVRDPLVGLAKGAGSIADIPLEAIGHMPINEWVGLDNREKAFDLMPITSEKAVTIAQMNADAVNRDWYMAQYVRSHGGDYAAAKGLPQLLAPIIQPDATVLERGLMALGVPSQMIARTQAGWRDRADQLVDGTLASNAHPELKTLLRRYNAGELGEVGTQESRDRVLDEMTTQGFGYSNDPFVGMLAEMLLDPIILVGMGSGLALKSVRAGSMARRMSSIGRMARAEVTAGRASPQLRTAIDQVDDLMRAQNLGTSGRFDDTYQFGRELAKSQDPEVRRLVQKADATMTKSDRVKVQMGPVIEAAAGVSRALNEPFRIFGKDGAAGLLQRRFARNSTQGGVSAFDTSKVAGLYRGVSDEVGSMMNDSLGYAMSYAQRSMINQSLVKQMRTSLKDSNGNMVRPDWMPDAIGGHNTPDAVLDALTIDKNGNPIDRRVENPGEAAQMENFMRRVKEQFVPELGNMPEGPARQKAHAAAMEKFKDDAAAQLSYASDGKLTVAEARQLLKNATDDELAFAHFLQWGKMIKDFEVAQKVDATGNGNLVSKQIDSVRQYEASGGQGKGPRKAGDEGLRMAEIIERATLIGKRELTMGQAKSIRDKLEKFGNDFDAAADYLAEVVGAKEILHQNFWSHTRVASNESFVKDIDTFLKSAIEEKRLVQEVSRDSLSPQLLALVERADKRGTTYEVGMAPATDKRYAPVHNSKGELKGYSAWMDMRVSKADIQNPTRFDVLRERLWTPIRAENMLQESRRKFIRIGVKEYELDRGAATAVFDAIREASTVDRTTMRAFTPDEFARIIDTVDLTPEMKMRLGKRGIAELTARALAGDVRMVGVTTRATGALKTQTAHYGNFMGVLAEKIYPLIRFNLNPFFLIQEWVEPYFFNILRGVKPGMKFGVDQVEFHTILDEWNMASVLADGFEAREFSMTGGYHARVGMGPKTLVGRLASKFPVGRVQEVKKANYANLTKKQFGENLHDAFQKQFPGQWGRIEAFFNEIDARGKPPGVGGHLSHGDIATRWYANKGMYDPDTRTTNMHHFDGAIPDDLGRIDGIRKSHLATMFGFDDIPAFRKAVQDPLDPRYMDEWDFRSQLVNTGMTNEYAVRAYNVARGLDVDDILDTIEQGYTDPAVGQAARDMTDVWLRTMSEIKGITKEEYAANKFATMPKWMDASGRLPQSAFLQLSDRLIQESGFPKMPLDDPRYLATQKLATEMMPDISLNENKVKAQKAHNNAAVKTAEGTVKPGKGLATEKRNVGGIDIDPNNGTESFKRRNDDAGMTPEDVAGVGEWYRSVGPMFTAIAHGMDEVTLKGLADEFNKNSNMKKIDPTSEAMANEVGARMLMAWGATQVQTSPRDGFAYALTIADAVSRGARPGADVLKPGTKAGPLTGTAAGIGLFNRQKAQLKSMLVDFDATVNVDGLGAKLHDFIDSLLNNEQRSWMRGQVDAEGNPMPTQMYNSPTQGPIPMQPGAMDIWMGRDAGFVDSPYLSLMQQRLMKLDPNLTKEAAMVKAQLESGFFFKKSVSKTVVIDEKTVIKQTDESAAAYATRKAAFEKEHNLPEGSMQDVWGGSPTPAQYEFMLERYNRITDELNAEGYLGRGYDEALAKPWTVADIQAIAWMRIQKSLDIDPGGPTNMFQQNATQVSFEIIPGKNTPLRDAIPMHRAGPDAKDLITTDVSIVLADMVQERTGVQITRSVPGRGGWRGGPDDYTLSPNTFWELLGPEQAVEDALDYIAYMTQQDMVFATRAVNRVGGKLPGQSSKKNHWSLDFHPDVDDAMTLDALGVWLEEQGLQWNGHMVGAAPGNRSILRSTYSPAWKGEASAYKGTAGGGAVPEGYIDVPVNTDAAGFEAMSALPDGVEAKLNDGSWATEAGLDDAIAVNVNRELVQVKHRNTDFAADRVRADERIAKGDNPETVYSEEIGRDLVNNLTERGRPDVAREMVGRDLEALTTVWDESLKDNDGNAWSVGRGEREVLSYNPRGEGPYLQSSPRGWNGATAWTRKRNATERVARGELGTRRGRLYLKSDDGRGGAATATTATHELFHFFADDLDPSGVAAIHDAYYTGVKKKRRPKNNNKLTVEAEEWMAAQFEEYASVGLDGVQHPTLVPIFNAYDAAMQSIDPAARTPNQLVDPGIKAADAITTVQKGARAGLKPELQRGPRMTWNVDEFRMMEAARVALQRAEEEAFQAHYYKRGRTLLERSINHPYLGMYPASYMWGKVLPELMRFLVKKPFGVDAPFAGMAMANHVWNAVQLEMATDNEGMLQELVEDFPEAMRFLQLMVPGTPWDIPVNMPAWTRRIAQDAWQGKTADIAGAMTDTAAYAFGPGRAPSDMFEFLQDFQNMGSRAAGMAMGTYVSEEDKEEEAALRKAQGLPALAPEPEPATRLVPGTGFQVSPQVP